MGVWFNTYMHYELAHVAQVWGWQGQQGVKADTTHVLVALAIIGCFMLFKIS